MPLLLLDVRVGPETGPQNVVGPFVPIVGVGGVAVTVTLMASEVTLHDPPVTWTAYIPLVLAM